MAAVLLKIKFLATIAAFLTLAAGQAMACACCADAGHRQAQTLEIDDWQREILDGVQFGKDAALYSTPCGDECLQGIDAQQLLFDLSVSKSDASWTFDFNDSLGTLTFSVPDAVSIFQADHKLDPLANMAELHTEFVLVGDVSGTGIFFGPKAQVAKGELILIGGGNMCFDASSFRNWMLTVTGEGSDFRLFGRLEPS